MNPFVCGTFLHSKLWLRDQSYGRHVDLLSVGTSSSHCVFEAFPFHIHCRAAPVKKMPKVYPAVIGVPIHGGAIPFLSVKWTNWQPLMLAPPFF